MSDIFYKQTKLHLDINSSEPSSFNSSYKTISNKKTLNFSEQIKFNSNYIPDVSFINAPKVNAFSESYWFNNSARLIETIETSSFSKGYLPFEEEVSVINNSENNNTDYEYFNSKLVNISQGYSWFDNSVPSKSNIFQTFLIPWNQNINNFELSFRMPKNDFNFEYNIEYVNADTALNIESALYPITDGDSDLGIQSNIDLSRANIEVEWVYGYPLSRSTTLEYNITDIVSAISLEYNTYYVDNYEFMMEYRKVKRFNSDNNLEYNITDIISPVTMEYSVGSEEFYNYNLEYNITDVVTTMDIEVFTFAPRDLDLPLEWMRVFPMDYNFNIEYRNVYNITEVNDLEFFAEKQYFNPLNLETKIPEVSKKLNLEFQKIVQEEIDLDIEVKIPEVSKRLPIEYNVNTLNRTLNIEYENINIEDKEVPLEFKTTKISKFYSINIESSLSANMDKEVNIEFLNPIVTRKQFQTYVIPLAYKNQSFQLYVLSVSDNELVLEYNIHNIIKGTTTNIETDIITKSNNILPLEYNINEINKLYSLNIEYNINEINKLYSLNIEYKNINIEDRKLNIEFDTTINRDIIFNTEFDINEIYKDYDLNLEVLTSTPAYYDINLESNIVVERDYELPIEFFINEIQAFYGLELEFDTTVEMDFITSLEFICSSVSKKLNIEFEILDLVYYYMNKGYNIIPWLYSSGTGNFDSTVNKMWNKDNPDNTTIEDGLYNQLLYKGYTIPNNIKFSDKENENFGCIIKDIHMKDIELTSKFLVFDRLNKESDDYLILGRRKKDKAEIVNLKKGKNLCIWDGIRGTFNELIRPQLNNIEYISIWRNNTEDWFTITDENQDHDLYFDFLIDDKLREMPFVMVISVSDDESYEITR